MKRILLLSLMMLLTIELVNAQTKNPTNVISQDIKYCESTFWNGNDLYIANFGGSQLNPLNQEGKGYILKYKEGKVSTLIATDGSLNAPKGMALKENHLFIADVNAVVVYNLADIKAKPQKIVFPKDDLFVNDLAIQGNILYATVTNTGKIYTIDISNLHSLSAIAPTLYVDVPGPNGILITQDKMYIVSYNPAGIPTSENVIYIINDIKNPKLTHFIHQSGQYDGIVMSPDNKTLYFSDWVGGKVGSIDMNTKKINYFTINLKNPLVGPADITLKNGSLYIPDLPNSRVVVIKAN